MLDISKMEETVEFLSSIGEEVEDAEEESFLLFSQDIPSSNLGFVDSKASTIELTIHSHEYTIHQSPTLLSSSRAGGTTGAVLWKITPLFASWLSNTASNPLWTTNHLTPSSTIVELGCGISALTALSLSPLLEPAGRRGHYLATDQEYVQRLFRLNLASNPPRLSSLSSSSSSKKGGKGASRVIGKNKQSHSKAASAASDAAGDAGGGNGNPHSNITFTSLDWETDIPDTLKAQIQVQVQGSASDQRGLGDSGGEGEEEEDHGFDLLLSCDCIYNEALISPFVRTCADIARLRSSAGLRLKPTICIIAQQQRSPDVFEAWLRETMRYFRVWRMSDEVLAGGNGDDKIGLASGSGYLVHGLILKD